MEIIFPSTQYISIILGNQLIQHKSKVVRCRTKGESEKRNEFPSSFSCFLYSLSRDEERNIRIPTSPIKELWDPDFLLPSIEISSVSFFLSISGNAFLPRGTMKTGSQEGKGGRRKIIIKKGGGSSPKVLEIQEKSTRVDRVSIMADC